jgi:hypothetical protein
LRDECLNGEIFYSLKEAQIVIESWRFEYNTRRPHPRSAIGRQRRSQFDQEKTRLWTVRMQYKLSHSAWHKKSVRSLLPTPSERS